jgi:hypothetical protein
MLLLQDNATAWDLQSVWIEHGFWRAVVILLAALVGFISGVKADGAGSRDTLNPEAKASELSGRGLRIM